MPRVSKKTEPVETPEPPKKTETKKTEPKKKMDKSKMKVETDPKVLNKHLKEKDKELAKIKMLVDKMVKVIE